jgi:hypothetical protein
MSHLKKKIADGRITLRCDENSKREKELISMVHGNLQWWAVVRTVKNVRTPQIRLLDHLNDCHLL